MESPKNTISPQKKKNEEIITRKSHKHSTTTTKKKSSKDIIGRRFSDEQIKSLESIFSVETKLEPKKKMQLATDLGLQPRQVAIWFQNKRARWKSKQMEQEYRDLRANYDCLYVQFDELKKEKQSLQMQVQELSELVKNLDNVNLTDGDDESKEYPNEETDNGDIMKTDDHDHERVISKDFEKTQEQELVSWSEEEEIISHLASPEKWCNFSSDGLFDQSSGTSNWWEN